MIDVCLLGTGGGMPTPDRFLSSLLINYSGKKILIDCGEGTQVSMKILGWGFKTIDVICITHSHGDHIVGLPGLLATIGNSGRKDPITIMGPKGIKHIVDGLNLINPYLPYSINIIEVENLNSNILELDNLSISCLQLDHSALCIGYSFYLKRKPKFNREKAEKLKIPKKYWNRLQQGESIVIDNELIKPELILGDERRGIKLSYITDTRPIENIVNFIKDSDLFVCEGTYGEDGKLDKAIQNKHMTFSEAANLALKGSVKELWLTHFSPAINNPEEYKFNAEKVFNNTIIGKDRMIKTLHFSE